MTLEEKQEELLFKVKTVLVPIINKFLHDYEEVKKVQSLLKDYNGLESIYCHLLHILENPIKAAKQDYEDLTTFIKSSAQQLKTIISRDYSSAVELIQSEEFSEITQTLITVYDSLGVQTNKELETMNQALSNQNKDLEERLLEAENKINELTSNVKRLLKENKQYKSLIDKSKETAEPIPSRIPARKKEPVKRTKKHENTIKDVIRQTILEYINNQGITTADLTHLLREKQIITIERAPNDEYLKQYCSSTLSLLNKEGRIERIKDGKNYKYYPKGKAPKAARLVSSTHESGVNIELFNTVNQVLKDEVNANGITVQSLTRLLIEDNKVNTKLSSKEQTLTTYCYNILNYLHKKGELVKEKKGIYVFYYPKEFVPAVRPSEKPKPIVKKKTDKFSGEDGLVNGKAVTCKGIKNIIINNCKVLLKEEKSTKELTHDLINKGLISDLISYSTTLNTVGNCLKRLSLKPEVIVRTKKREKYYRYEIIGVE